MKKFWSAAREVLVVMIEIALIVIAAALLSIARHAHAPEEQVAAATTAAPTALPTALPTAVPFPTPIQLEGHKIGEEWETIPKPNEEGYSFFPQGTTEQWVYCQSALRSVLLGFKEPNRWYLWTFTDTTWLDGNDGEPRSTSFRQETQRWAIEMRVNQTAWNTLEVRCVNY